MVKSSSLNLNPEGFMTINYFNFGISSFET